LSVNTLGWGFQVPALAERHRVINLDNRGIGQSDAPPGPYTIRQMADDTIGLLDHLDVGRASILGFSMGGMIGQEIALSHPERVDRLVLLASFARPGKALSDPWLSFFAQAFERGLDPVAFFVWALPFLYTPTLLTQAEAAEAVLQQLVSNPHPPTAAGIVGQVAAVSGFDTLERLSQIQAPTLVLVGAEDVLTPPHYSRELAARIPGARLQVLERGGHGVHWEYPEAVNTAVLAFLADSSP
jgi:3-oxoadipate enol-lactonase